MTCRLEMSDFEPIWRGIGNLTINPLKNIVYNVVPAFGAFSSGYTPIIPEDHGQRSMIPFAASQNIVREIEHLRKCAELGRQISVYTALNFHFTSFGGGLSLTKPILVIPYHRLFRPNSSSFGDGRESQDSPNALTDEETKFYIARELGHLKTNDAFFKTTAKIILVAGISCFWAAPLGWAGAAVIASVAFAIYISADRFYECKMDCFAIKTLGKAINNPKRAAHAALSALEKQRAENLEKREKNFLCSWYLTQSGNNLLDITHPFLTSRIASIQKNLRITF